MQQVVKPIRGFTEGYVDDLLVHTHVKRWQKNFPDTPATNWLFLETHKRNGYYPKVA